MAQITAIEQAGRKEGRWAVAVDGEALGIVSLGVIERLSLHVGDVLDEGQIQALREEVAALKTYDRALGMLAARGRSARGLERQLVQKGEAKEHAKSAVERLQQSGLLDDDAYARSYARNKLLGAGHARRRLQLDLVRKGVTGDVARKAIDEVLSDPTVDAHGIVEEVARKKAKSLQKLEPEVRTRRLYGFLARRGFSADEIRRGLRAALGKGQPGED